MQKTRAGVDAQGQQTDGEGAVVWDHKGLVVLWSDGHCSRFSWEELREVCVCPECQAQRDKETITF